jgi:hypothetical protein
MTVSIHPATPKPKRMWRWVVAGVAGLFLGLGSAVALTGGSMGAGRLVVGQWSTDPQVGASAANPWLRARIARVGLLALTKEETLYFDRTTDEAGGPLREACRYRISGQNLPTRWWSLTIYDQTQFLPRNTDGASSLDATQLLAGGKSTFEAILSPAKPMDNQAWLSSKAAGTFSITLRLYNPNTIEPHELAQIAFPKIALLDCDGARSGEARP